MAAAAPPMRSSDLPPWTKPKGPLSLSRGYLSLRQAGAASEEASFALGAAQAGPADDRCMVVMEVVRKDNGVGGGVVGDK